MPSLELKLVTSESPSVSELSALHEQSQLKAKYKKIVLISHRNHVPRLIADPDALTISTDWLAWRHCLDAGHHSIYFESLLEEWPEERGNPDLHFQTSASWMYVKGKDVTSFRGVSLGKQFNKQMSLFRHGYLRQWHALVRACRKYSPEILEFYDIRAEYDYLDDDTKKKLVCDVASKFQLELIDRNDRLSPDPEAFHDLPFQMQNDEPRNLKYFLRLFYETIVDIWFRMRFVIVKPEKRVYLLLNWPALKNLLKNLQGIKLNPVILARQFPKSADFVLDCWRKNILLAGLPLTQLDEFEENRLVEIEESVENSFVRPESAFELVQQNFIRENFFLSGFFRRAAIEVKSYERLFDRHKIAHVVVGDSENKTCRLLLELAYKKGIHADELLNGVFLTDEYFDARSGDSFHQPYVKRLLTWGLQNESWFAERNETTPIVRTGYPALGAVRREFSKPETDRGNALILPISMEGIKALNTNIFSTLVDTVRGLRSLGYASIRIKVHSGHPVKKYFEDIAAYFALDCEIFQAGGLAEHIEWADLVIGPIDSGAFVETMAMGTPYYPMRLHPSSLRNKYFGTVKPSESVPELLEAVRRNNFPEPQEFLEYFCSTESIPNASTKVWEILEQAADAN